MAILAKHYWMSIWEWGLFLFGVIFYYWAISGKDKQYYFPGTMLIVTVGALILRKYGLFNFPLWQFWPILFLSIGFGFLILWGVRETKVWAIIPGSIFVFIGSAGLTHHSWWRYQLWLREIYDLWPLILIFTGILLVIRYWRNSMEKDQIDKKNSPT